MNSVENYPDLKGQQTNLFKCFLPQAWQFGSQAGVSAFVHPDGVYDDPRGGLLREKLYPKLGYHFQFTNELRLFAEVHHCTVYSLNVYNNSETGQFEYISNLFAVESIEKCYDNTIVGSVPGIKDDEGNWNTSGHPGRIVHVGQKELELFAKLFDGSDNWKQAKLPILHAQALIDVLFCFANQHTTLSNISENIYCAEMWHETNNQVDGTIKRDVHFPDTVRGQILSGPHIGVSNPFFKTSRKECKLNSDYDSIDLTQIPQDYLSRCNYSIACTIDEYEKREPDKHSFLRTYY